VADEAVSHPTLTLWDAFDGEGGQRERMPIFCGVPLQTMNDVMFVAMARSRPAARLLARAPELMRNLSHQTTVHTERCVGHVRGPIQWSETITAWSSGVGVNDVFVCSSPRRDFDVPENRLLVWLLKRIVSAGRRANGDAGRLFPAEDVARVVALGQQSQRLLSHPALRGIPIRKLDGREWRLVRKSRHLDTYQPVIRLAERVNRPFSAMDALGLSSSATQEHHRVMTLLFDAVRARGHAVPLLSVRGDFVVAGHVRYRNPYVMVDRRLSGENGLFFGDVRILTRAETVGGDSGASALVVSADDAAAVVERVLGASSPLMPPVPPTAMPSGNVEDQSSASGLVQLPGSYSS